MNAHRHEIDKSQTDRDRYTSLSAELFPPESVAMPSPRLQWMEAHGIKSKQRAACWTVWQEAAPFNPFTAYELDEALAGLAAKLNIKTWNE